MNGERVGEGEDDGWGMKRIRTRTVGGWKGGRNEKKTTQRAWENKEGGGERQGAANTPN